MKNYIFASIKTILQRLFIYRFYVLLSIFIWGASIPFFVFYGPFHNIKSIVTGTLWTSSRFKNIPLIFLSQKQINAILPDAHNGKNIQKIDTYSYSKNKKLCIKLYSIKTKTFNGKALEISDPLSIKTAYTSYLGTKGEPLSKIAFNKKAIAAINAGGFLDYFSTGSGGIPNSFLMSNGNIVYIDKDLSMNDEVDVVGFNEDGVLIVGVHKLNDLMKYRIKEAVCFGPPLVVNGKPVIAKGDGGWGIAPRTAIGQKKTGEVIFVVIDGRTLGCLGATLKELQDVLLELGAYTAVNLDGGSSSTMYFNGRIINKPATPLGERNIASAFIVVP